MGTWSGEPFGNDTAADWAWELEDVHDWGFVRDALRAGIEGSAVDEDAATVAIAAAEVVAHGLGRPTQVDAYTEEVVSFVGRVPPPPTDVVEFARAALAAATRAGSALTEVWADDSSEWHEANEHLRVALGGGSGSA